MPEYCRATTAARVPFSRPCLVDDHYAHVSVADRLDHDLTHVVAEPLTVQE